ncbi:MAG: polysaccharide biosynthesis tyrosine autokinase [Anaerolineae bacterium]|nr:polysaccharide biosynthesis tyrosine autokinase [Anaerolineae bacterium]
MMDLGKYFKIGLRWWWLILLSMALSATASYFYSQDQPRVYAARTTLMVGASVIENTKPNEQDLGLSRTLAQVYGELALRRPITQAVIDRLGLQMSPDELSEMIQTGVIPSAQLLEIYVFDVHPQRAQLLANAIAEELILQSPGGSGNEQERDKFIRAQMQDLQSKIQDADAKIKELENKLGGLTSAVEIAEAQSQLTQLEQLKGDYQSNYNQFLSNVSEASPNRLAVFESATEPTTPVSPNVKMNVAIAAAAGLVLALGTIIFLEFFSDTLIWNPGETSSVLGLPVLGAVGRVDKNSDTLLIKSEEWSPNLDALRTLRSTIMLAAEGNSLSTLLITSSLPGEGKSFLSANLAAIIASPGASLANIITSPGSRVILIDADLHRPSLHEMFDMPNLMGLADVLGMPESTMEALLKKTLRPTGIDNLLLLPAGRAPLDPGALIHSSKFQKMLALLKPNADLIIIDSGPVLRVVETKVIANLVDGVVLVISDGQVRRKAVQQIIDYFRGKPNNNLLGLVFNRVKAVSRGYGYYSGYSTRDKMQRVGRNQQADTGMVTLAEATDYLGVSEETVRRWCDQGRLPALKKGRKWLLRLEDLNEFVGTYQHGSGDESSPSTVVEKEPAVQPNSPNGQEHPEPQVLQERP